MIDSIDPNELALLASIIAISLSQDKTIYELNILGSLLTSIGDIISTIAAQREALESLNGKKQNSKGTNKKSKS